MVDDSRSAKIFANFQIQLEGAVPSDTPGWITEQYAGMSAICAPAAQ
jgi:membrane protein required for colicin V production